MPKGDKNYDQSEDALTQSSTIDDNDLDDLLNDLNAEQLGDFRGEIPDFDFDSFEQEMDDLLKVVENDLQTEQIKRLSTSTGITVEQLNDPGSLSEEQGEKLKDAIANNKAELPEEQIEQLAERVIKLRDAGTQKAIERLDKSIKRAEAQIEHLTEKPNWKDKIRCFFKHGRDGVDGEIARLQRKVDAADQAKRDLDRGYSVEDRHMNVEGLKRLLKNNKLKIEQHAGSVIALNLESSFTGIRLSPEDRRVAEEGVKKVERLEEQRKLLKEQLKDEKRVIKYGEKAESVRDAFNHGPKKGTDDSVKQNLKL